MIPQQAALSIVALVKNAKPENKSVVYCEKCGKKLIERLSNGLWYFVFGKRRKQNGEFASRCPVNMIIHGSLLMQCISSENGCGHWNTLNYLPNLNEFQSVSTEPSSNQSPTEP